MRVTTAQVLEIMQTNLEAEDITPFLITSSKLCDSVFGSDCGYSDDLQAEIERWLAAHLASVARDPRVKSETAGPASTTYFGQDGTGLKASPYGQQVLVLDYQGRFAGIGETPEYNLEVLG
jgi:hypothetical protein